MGSVGTDFMKELPCCHAQGLESRHVPTMPGGAHFRDIFFIIVFKYVMPCFKRVL